MPVEGGTTVVAVGASAGGLEALRALFAAIPADPRFAFVLVTHLSPTHTSNMAELLGRAAAMPVTEAREGETVRPAHVYVIPPVRLMSIRDGVLHLERSTPRPAILRTIDHFMLSLAEDRLDRSAGIVLSGTDHDGTVGLKEIKAAGGLAIVQDPETAQYPGMPQSAITAGIADFVLPVERMGQALLAFVDNAPDGLAFDVKGPAPEDVPARRGPIEEILGLVQARTGHDFRWYRSVMLLRRLRRRMGLRGVRDIEVYLGLLRESREEIDALVRDFLISVTEFFRDPEAWEALDEIVLPQLVRGRGGDGASVRVWTPGCATGEESYGIAILLLERLSAELRDVGVNVFGTDVDLDALQVARAGSYPEGIAAAIPPQHLARHFDKAGDRYTVRKSLRECVLFAQQNLVRDPPFSKLDLIICRNLLIYFEPAQQSRILELFHFALNPGGFLFLGRSESLGTGGEQFEAVSRRHRIFRRLGAEAHLPAGFAGHWSGPGGFLTPLPKRRHGTDRSPADLVREQLDGRQVTAALLVNRDDRVVYLHGDTTRYAQQTGEPVSSLQSMLKDGLRIRIRAGMHRAVAEGRPVALRASIKRDTGWSRVEINIEPLTQVGAEGLLLLCFREPAAGRVAPEPEPPQPGREPERGAEGDRVPAQPNDRALVQQLEEELRATREELAAAVEEGESATAELRVTNEEAMSLNEELQSSNEELQTSKEELQSLNEELATVNSELEAKLAELERALNDVRNLMDSARVATLFLDRELRIRRFTREVARLFHVIDADEGRPLSDITSRVIDPELVADARGVLESLVPSEKEIATGEGGWFLRRILPYRTQQERIDGVVLTYVDITRLRLAAEETRRLAIVLRDSSDAVITYDVAGRIGSWNKGAQRIYGHTRDEALALDLDGLLPAAERDAMRALIDRALRAGSAGPENSRRITRDGRVLDVSVTVSALSDPEGRPGGVLSTERDITEQLRLEAEMRFRAMADDIPTLLRIDDPAGQAEFLNRAWLEFTGERGTGALLGRGWLQYVHPEDVPVYLRQVRDARVERRRFEIDLRLRRSDGHYSWMRSTMVARLDHAGQLVGYTSVAIDIDERKRAEQAVSEAALQKDEFLAMLAHELRNPLAPIRNAGDMIARLVPADPKLAWATGVIARQTQHLARLIDDLMDVARITSNKITLHREPIEVSVLVARAYDASQLLMNARRQRFSLAVPPGPLFVEGDLVRLTQVVGNLLNNASKYTGEQGEITLSATASAAEVEISVRDTGAGIAPDMLPRVFDLFAQGDRTLDRAQGGLGIGLTLVHRLVQLHGGGVEARSAGPGMGSEFIVRLPRLHLPQLAPPPGRPDDPPSVEGTRRILVVDDNVDGAESIAGILELSGHEVRVAFEGAAALDAAAAFKPHVIVLDIGLPGMNGYDVARRLRSRRETADALLIALTGYGQAEDALRAQKAGFDHHLVKPVALEQLLALIGTPRNP